MRAKPGVNLRNQWIADPALIERPDTYAEFSPQVVYIPMQQHVGAPCTPVVGTGDNVLHGPFIGKSNGIMSANVHASVSGVVLAVAEHGLVSGGATPTQYLIRISEPTRILSNSYAVV